MITVKFFGLVGLDSNLRRLAVKEGTIRQTLDQVMQGCPGISEQQLLSAVMFVNGRQVKGSRRFAVKLKDGDELALLSPICGG